jgi:hypothetical protein
MPKEHPVEWHWLERDTTGKGFIWKTLKKEIKV